MWFILLLVIFTFSTFLFFEYYPDLTQTGEAKEPQFILEQLQKGRVDRYEDKIEANGIRAFLNLNSRKKIVIHTKDNKTYYNKTIDSHYISEIDKTIEARKNDRSLEKIPTTVRYGLIMPTLTVFSALVGFIWLVYIISSLLEQRRMTRMKDSEIDLEGDQQKTTFQDVAGNEEEKEELTELVDFLKKPQKYEKMGAKVPKGVLLQGPPGTGKTLLAKALAGEAGVPFYATSGSEFVQIYVGMGALKIRKLFKELRENAPCILFIDEIDILGGKRSSGGGWGGTEEKDQTLNQLLTEMDGFNASTGIIIVGATNRKDMLDPALLRPGRFDRHFTVGLPDAKAREAILKVHAYNKQISSEVNFAQLAKQTTGFSGAELASVLNEASILAVRNNQEEITMVELEEAVDRVMMGPAKKSKKYDEEERKMVAYHEAGHAVIGIKLKHAPKVQKITIIPRGDAGGYNLMLPEKETIFSSKKRMLANIVAFLGGRAAEELMFDDISNGTYSDFQQATSIANEMVTSYGMSELGPMQNDDSLFVHKPLVDAEVKKIIDECMDEARKIMKENKSLLEQIANTLLEQETITKDQLDQIVNPPKNQKHEKTNNKEKKVASK
ncbi:ATP-dependent zinc metalloprotease FtsH [Candidatus Phytoplasma pruni]|uniref:ATP-dependent zinc metalloprotease FtsH n=2 Tax=Candidatus Phytoplasma pruni TaxID=479893 RepID=A0A851H9T7_9MOLU|nr:ATP-dependent zinc metalloprotease FtsH [Candidatus Phytoplasma pruni]